MRLKKNNFKLNKKHLLRNNFYSSPNLQKIKQKTNINQNVGLTPHNLRRAFATYHAENGLPLPLLSKLLGHSSIRTTALYWQNIYGEDEVEDILAGKKWLEHSPFGKNKEKKPPLPEISEQLIKRNLPEPLPKNLDFDVVKDKSVITTEKPNNKERSLDNFDKLSYNSLLTDESNNYQPQKLISEISPKNHREFSLNTTSEKTEISKQSPPVITKREQITNKEKILLTRIKELEGQLKQVQTENDKLRIDKEKAEKLAHQEKERVDNYQQQLKIISKFVYQWQKIGYYNKLEQERKAQIEQPPPPWKPNK